MLASTLNPPAGSGLGSAGTSTGSVADVDGLDSSIAAPCGPREGGEWSREGGRPKGGGGGDSSAEAAGASEALLELSRSTFGPVRDGLVFSD